MAMMAVATAPRNSYPPGYPVPGYPGTVRPAIFWSVGKSFSPIHEIPFVMPQGAGRRAGIPQELPWHKRRWAPSSRGLHTA
eukprot:1053691-Rhodomonas_salina.1